MSLKGAEQEHCVAVLAEWLEGESLEPGSRVIVGTGVSKSTWYKYLSGSWPIPLWLPQRLYLILPRLDLFARINGASELGITMTETPLAEIPGGLHRAALRLGSSVGVCQQHVAEATADGVVDTAEGSRIVRQAEAVQREAEALKLAVGKAG